MFNRISYLFIFIFFISSFANAGNFRMRAREHYEIHNINFSGQNIKYTGFSNTINVWYEEPFKYSFGLSVGPVLGDVLIDDKSKSLAFGEEIKIFSLGLEAKYFFLPQYAELLFTRVGTTWTQILSDGIESNQNGLGLYLGFGYEFKIGKFGLAPEVALRHTFLERDNQISSFTPSVGFHFYKLKQ